MPDDLNTPEPAPQPGGGVDIWPLVCADAKSMGVPDAVLADMRARDAAGRCKYGVPLQAHNGRRPLVDAYQEALDLVAYLRQAIEEGRCGATVALFGCALVIVQRLRAMVALYE
jgi:hypothetical protein